MRFLLFFWFLPLFGLAQESDKSMILSQREASNTALRAFDEALNATFLTDDVLITTGAGTLISGKKGIIRVYPRSLWSPNVLGPDSR